MLYSSGTDHGDSAPVSFRTGKDSSCLEKCFSKPVKREDSEKPAAPKNPTIENWEDIGTAAYIKMFAFVALSFLMPWLSATVTEVRRIWVLFKTPYLLELILKNFSGLTLR